MESLLDAAEELWEEEKSAATLDDVVICSECLAARRAGEPACPECGQDIFRAASTYLPPAAPRPKEDAKAAPDVPERARGRGTARPPAISCEDLGHPRPWTDAELDLARGKPDQDPSGITIGGRPLPPPPKRDRKAERDRRAAREAAGKEAPRVV